MANATIKNKASRKAQSTKKSTKKSALGEEQVSIDRRRSDRRDEPTEQAEVISQPAPQLEKRKKVNRRRQIDPTTCERDYTDQEVEFMNALDNYKRQSGRMFPTCSEVLEVLRGLGYVKLSAAELASVPSVNAPAASAKPMPSDELEHDAIALDWDSSDEA